jgi:hypothetical protein
VHTFLLYDRVATGLLLDIDDGDGGLIMVDWLRRWSLNLYYWKWRQLHWLGTLLLCILRLLSTLIGNF